ncbi:hypothetical protein [Candidatus Berkiella aquae]|uniref:Uncharacterized protein n=1 Tax=Candidatus Berkiella aquae TaxID=295108 RepID=A0A0Q9YYA3_9GAMM|nr:hypothetical protein [Candidatus Berkiella aquae]MCS5711900.1 hypothetical protein [Candidatus Berkiella aquae]
MEKRRVTYFNADETQFHIENVPYWEDNLRGIYLTLRSIHYMNVPLRGAILLCGYAAKKLIQQFHAYITSSKYFIRKFIVSLGFKMSSLTNSTL